MLDAQDLLAVIEGASFQKILHKKINVSLYQELAHRIPDDVILIREIFPHDEIEVIYENYKLYLSQFEIFPYLGTLGDAVICIGFGQANKGNIYYFDFDFGDFYLDKNLEEFCSKLLD